jgi:hypothetical protein
MSPRVVAAADVVERNADGETERTVLTGRALMARIKGKGLQCATFPTNRKSYVLISMLTFRASVPPLVIAPAKVKELIGRVRRAEARVTYQKGKSEYRKGRLRTAEETAEVGEAVGEKVLTGAALWNWTREKGCTGANTAKQRTAKERGERSD